MLRRILLPTTVVILAYGFWISPDFKEIAAGVAIFLFGMLFLESGFRAFTGGVLSQLLARGTDRLWKSIGLGIVSSTVMQSSSLVSVITISFLSAGLMSLTAGIGIILGANIGTTTGAWLVAGLGLKIKISAYAMPMLVFGIVLVMQSSKSLKGLGYILAGLGFIFLGIHYMKEGFDTFHGGVDLSALAMTGFLGLVVYTFVGLLATVIMQSSHATLVLTITAVASQQISYENGLALAIGANIGTTITAIIGAISANFQGKRLAGAHLVFNLMTALVAISFMAPLVVTVDGISDVLGIRQDDYALKLAVFHTIFNVLGVAIMIPLVGRLVSTLERVIPERVPELNKPMYLNEAVVDFPEALVEAVRKETVHLYDSALEVIAHGLSIHRSDILSDADLDRVFRSDRKVMDIDLDEAYARRVKSLYSHILSFISHHSQNLPANLANALFDLRKTSGNIVEAVKDVKHLRKNMLSYIPSRNEEIRKQYNGLRAEIATLLRLIDRIRQGDDTVDLFDIDEIKLRHEEENALVNGTLERLIREGRITAAMGSSLANDIGYTRAIIWNLSEMASVLFGSRDIDERAVEQLVALDEDELSALVEPSSGAPDAPRQRSSE